MDSEVYQKIITLIEKDTASSRKELFEKLKETYGKEEKFGKPISELSFETFTSIYSNIRRRYMFRSSYWRRLKENEVGFYNKYKEYEELDAQQKEQPDDSCPEKSSLSRNIILKMAKETQISPALMARLILQGFMKMGALELKDVPKENVQKISISSLMKDVHLILNERLGYEVFECCVMDDDYGPIIDAIRNVVGLEYEIKLEGILKQKNLCYVREDEMREKGFDKTPDIKLDVPIYIKGCLVSWIDSKASFGDLQSHAENYENQFKWYLNRFGSGLVIYWFGYLAELENIQHHFNSSQQNRKIVVSDHFPDEFTELNIESLIE